MSPAHSASQPRNLPVPISGVGSKPLRIGIRVVSIESRSATLVRYAPQPHRAVSER
jgi:hypothetical protein